MVTINNKIIEIEFTEELLEKWTKLYFKEHPRAKKRPIKNPSHPSINEWCVLKRQAMNSLKQNWKSFTIFVIELPFTCINASDNESNLQTNSPSKPYIYTSLEVSFGKLSPPNVSL